jgi:hypothetical protein
MTEAEIHRKQLLEIDEDEKVQLSSDYHNDFNIIYPNRRK